MYAASRRADLRVRLGLEVVAARRARRAHLLDVVAVRLLAGVHRGLVDRELEALVEDALGAPRPSRAITCIGMSRHQIVIERAITRAATSR